MKRKIFFNLLLIGGSLKTNKRFSVKQEKEAFANFFSERNKNSKNCLKIDQTKT